MKNLKVRIKELLKNNKEVYLFKDGNIFSSKNLAKHYASECGEKFEIITEVKPVKESTKKSS